jgi:Mn2+/Fe2+ NRAMP family transporter
VTINKKAELQSVNKPYAPDDKDLHINPYFIVMMHVCNNKKVMGENTNKRWSNVLGSITPILMSAAAIALIYFQLK